MNLRINELRIGNIISFNNRIEKETDVYINARFFSSFSGGRALEEMNPEEQLTGYYSGVLLTEERLLRFGFENKLGLWYCNEYIFLTINGDVYFGDVYNVDSEKIAKTPYVHQLQNLCFALKGTELKLTDKS